MDRRVAGEPAAMCPGDDIVQPEHLAGWAFDEPALDGGNEMLAKFQPGQRDIGIDAKPASWADRSLAVDGAGEFPGPKADVKQDVAEPQGTVDAPGNRSGPGLGSLARGWGGWFFSAEGEFFYLGVASSRGLEPFGQRQNLRGQGCEKLLVEGDFLGGDFQCSFVAGFADADFAREFRGHFVM